VLNVVILFPLFGLQFYSPKATNVIYKVQRPQSVKEEQHLVVHLSVCVILGFPRLILHEGNGAWSNVG